MEFLVAAGLAGIAYLWGSDEEETDELEMIRSKSPHKTEVCKEVPDRTDPIVKECPQTPCPSLSELDRVSTDDSDTLLVDSLKSPRPERDDSQT